MREPVRKVLSGTYGDLDRASALIGVVVLGAGIYGSIARSDPYLATTAIVVIFALALARRAIKLQGEVDKLTADLKHDDDRIARVAAEQTDARLADYAELAEASESDRAMKAAEAVQARQDKERRWGEASVLYNRAEHIRRLLDALEREPENKKIRQQIFGSVIELRARGYKQQIDPPYSVEHFDGWWVRAEPLYRGLYDSLCAEAKALMKG